MTFKFKVGQKVRMKEEDYYIGRFVQKGEILTIRNREQHGSEILYGFKEDPDGYLKPNWRNVEKNFEAVNDLKYILEELPD